MFNWVSLIGMIPEAVKLTREVVKAIRRGDKKAAGDLAQEAAEQQALFASGRARLDE